MTVRPKTLSILRAVASVSVALAVCVCVLGVPAIARADSIFAVAGRGWGHGIGMTQYGAMGYANQGWDYKRILGWYFQHTTIATRAELTVKVDVEDGKLPRGSWLVTAGSTITTLTLSDPAKVAHSLDVTGGVAVWVQFSGGKAVVRSDLYDAAAKTHAVGSVVATFPAAVIASTGPMASSKVRLIGTSGPFSNTNIAWRGNILFSPHDTTTGNAINYVPMEQYLRGVVPRESPSSWPVQALNAQAVAARSYAYDGAKAGSVLWCTTMSQVYNGADSGPHDTHEADKTDAAVAATANEFVVYGSTVVKTFFSSSSGGRTANSKDVWFSNKGDDTSPPYYTSVVDDDQAGNPYYRWTLPDMSGASLAGTIRSHYPADAQASPATITNVTIAAGTSGFVRYVTLHWSKGADTEVTGHQFQLALGMRSSAFTVTLKNPPPPPATRYQDSDAHPLWTGAFTVIKTTSASGGTYRRSVAAGASLTVTFKGTSVSWIGVKGNHMGKAEVSLDGTRLATVDLYDSSTHYRVALWTKTGLSADTTHTLVIKTLGAHRTGSGGSYVAIDAIDIAGTLLTTPRPPAWKRYQQNVAAVKYSSGWATSTLAGLSGGTHAFSHVTSATATFTFTGTRARWIGKRASNYGKAWVSVDGAAPVLVDLYSATTRNQQRLFESASLSAGTHTLTIRVAGTKNAKATHHYVDVDAFEALQ
jgi:SpoIID/LytB domain protein